MKTSEVGINLIKKFESLKLKAYKCPAGVWTIGYGHTKNVNEGMIIIEVEANRLLKQDLTSVEQQINGLGLQLNQNQFDALVSFTFNLGIGNLSTSTLLIKIKENPNNFNIVNEFIRWIYANGKQLRGLLKRRLTEAILFIT